MSLESAFDEAFVARLAAAEKQVQQSYRPIIGVHKWFARRPGTLFRGLMLSELAQPPLRESFFEHHELEGIVLDPFMGGGTTLFEANRLGLSTVGYDTNPMSRWICERELEELDVDRLEEVGEEVCVAAEEQLGHLYATDCEECGEEVAVKSFLWVKAHHCECGHETLLFPGPYVAGTGMKRHTHEVLVCGRCRSVRQFAPDAVPDDCPCCGAAYAETKVGSTGTCRCGREFMVPGEPRDEPLEHSLFALEYHCASCKGREGRRGRFFKGADAADHERYSKAVEQLAGTDTSRIPDTAIPDGDETKRLHRWGYSKFRELHNDRQLLGLATLAADISRRPKELQPALATVFSDFVRYQNMVCRYDTAALKILDIFSIHAFPVNRVQCEAALIGLPRIGSGGYRHFLRKYANAKRYCEVPFETRRDGAKKERVEIAGERIAAEFVSTLSELDVGDRALLRSASITDEPLEDETVDLVLTDPPYYAMVQYSELMDFCYSWLRQLAPETPYFGSLSGKSTSEVGGNQTLGRDLPAFAEGLSAVYQAAAKALKPGRPFAFTYHHNELKSYAAVVVACVDAGLVPITTLPCPSEMRGSVHISKTSSSRVDTVFVLRKPPAVMPAEVDADIAELVKAETEHLLEADLVVTDGDRRCLRYGLIAEAAMRRLAPNWDSSAPIDERLGRATDLMRLLDADPNIRADGQLADNPSKGPLAPTSSSNSAAAYT
jgi:adenine-specific DNA methylase